MLRCKFKETLDNFKTSDFSGPTSDKSCDLRNVHDLDISQTLVPSWNTCTEICKTLNRLKVLTVSGNPWKLFSNEKEKKGLLSSLSESMPILEELVIGEMNYTWDEIIIIASALPNLR